LDNIPKRGPVIFTGNHANQFIDGVMVMATCQLNLSYLIAEKSWKRKVIGNIAWAMGAVPVKRAQDTAKPGTGMVRLSQKGPDEDGNILLVGINGTVFTSELAIGDKIRCSGTSVGLKVTKVINDSNVLIENTEDIPDSIKSGSAFDILKKTNLSELYEKVRCPSSFEVTTFSRFSFTHRTKCDRF